MALGQLASMPGGEMMMGDPTLAGVMGNASYQLTGRPPTATPLWQNPTYTNMFGPELSYAFQMSYDQQRYNQQIADLQRQNQMLQQQLAQMQQMNANPLAALMGGGGAGGSNPLAALMGGGGAAGGNALAALMGGGDLSSLLGAGGMNLATAFGNGNSNPFMAMMQAFGQTSNFMNGIGNTAGGTQTAAAPPPAGVDSSLMSALSGFFSDDPQALAALNLTGGSTATAAANPGNDLMSAITQFLSA